MKLLCCALLLCTISSYALDSKEDTQWVSDLGGSVTRNAQGRVTGVNLRGTWVEDSDLRRLNQYPELSVLDLSLTHITDGGMQELKNLRGITDFNLYFAEYVTDEGVAAIKDWKQLKRLNLHGTKAGDSALEHIAGLTSLESLDVGSTLMTDVGLERLTSLTNLKELTMGGNELGDAGLQALRQMPNLTYLDLSGREGNDKNVWTISMSNVGLQALLTLKNLRDLRFAWHQAGRSQHLEHHPKMVRAVRIAHQTPAPQGARLQPHRRRSRGRSHCHPRVARSGPERHLRHGKRSSPPRSSQAGRHRLHWAVGGQSRRLPQ